MKLTIAAFVLACSAFSISASGKTAVSQADPIESIRQHYASINKNVPLYRRVKKNLAGFSAEGGELLAYYHGPSVMKMVATFFGETGKAVEEYYYWNGKLIFVFRKEQRYDKPLSGKVTSTKENRYYFDKDKLIKWIGEDGKEVTDFQSSEADYLKTSRELIEAAGSKNKTVESKP